MSIYLDHNAGSPLRDEAKSAMIEAMPFAANASSIHSFGRKARAFIEKARQHLADLVGADVQNVTFTSGGSEANSTLLTGKFIKNNEAFTVDRILVSAIEHDAVLKSALRSIVPHEIIPVLETGQVDLNWLKARLQQAARDSEKLLIAVMLANNETGIIQPVKEVASLANNEHVIMCDAVQGPGKLSIDIEELGVDFMTLSAHKLGASQGIGAIVKSKYAPQFVPLISGGGQEQFMRAGTENVLAISSFGAAIQAIQNTDEIARIEKLRNELESQLSKAIIVGAGMPRLPNTSCLLIEGGSAETLLISLDLQGFSVSSGSACSSGKVNESHVLKAMGIEGEPARSSLRISLGWNTTGDEIKEFTSALNKLIDALPTNVQKPAA